MMRRSTLTVYIGTMITGILSLSTLPREAVAQTVCSSGVVVSARSDFRRTTDPSKRGPVGRLVLRQEGDQQTVHINIYRLTETDLGVHMSTNSFFDGTNSPAFFITQLDRKDPKKGKWARLLIGTNGAPLEFQAIGVTCLTDIQLIRSIDITNPGTTNLDNCVTNLVGQLDCDTNIFVDSFLWAPIPELLAKKFAGSFNRKVTLLPPTALPPSPDAKGQVQLRYNGRQGRSLLDVHVFELLNGQTYSFWISDGGTNFDCGQVVMETGGKDGRFMRDTKFGDPLPKQSATVADLAHRVYEIRDASGNIHLQGDDL